MTNTIHTEPQKHNLVADMFPQVAFQICRRATSLEYMFGLIQQESLKLNFYCERVGSTLVIWPKLYGKVNGINNLEETNLGIYAQIEVIDRYYKTSLWPLEALQHIQFFVSEVNPHTRKVYAVFNLKEDMGAFLESKEYKVMRLGACLTEGLLVTQAFKPPSELYTINYTEVAVNCQPNVGKDIWESLISILHSKSYKRSGDLRVKICIEKKLMWEMAVNMLFDISELEKVISVFNNRKVPWKESVVGQQITSVHPDNKLLEAINRSLSNGYAISNKRSSVRDMVDLPIKFTANMLQSMTFGFGHQLPIIGVPPPLLLPPTGDIVFATLLEEEQFSKFIKETTSERQMENFDVIGIIISSILSRNE